MSEKREAGQATQTIFFENEVTRVSEWRFPASGGCTGWHRHDYDLVVVPLFDGTLEMDLGGGERTTAELKTGIPYFRKAPIEHDVINVNDFEYVFVEIEFLK